MYPKAYKKRWYLLLVFVYYSCINAIQMTQYASITETVARYYEVSNFSVNWTSLLYMVLYPILVAPASWLIEKHGLRLAYTCGCVGTMLGLLIKLFSIQRQRFWVVLLGQVFTAGSSVFIMCLPPKIAAVWFKPSEVSKACALGSLGPNLGNALGYLLAVSIVPNKVDPLEVAGGLNLLSIISAALGLPVTLAVLFYLPSKPPHVPSQPRSSPRFPTHSRGFLIHLLAYSINLGVFSTAMILLSELVMGYFKGAMEHAGRMGFCMMIFGLPGSAAFGVFLDKTHMYKQACVAIALGSKLSLLLLLLAFQRGSLGFAYLLCSAYGVFANPIIPVGYEMGIEVSYPSDEGTVAGLLFAASQLASVVLGISVAHVNSQWGPSSALWTMIALLSIGTVLELLVPNQLLRLGAPQPPEQQEENLNPSIGDSGTIEIPQGFALFTDK